ncbi:unnamed protein product [Amoebophrya sp. A120]|nr:unnamed protein product [Amoebophrya sp. A120]|eukprot:GSA120T00000567001.1
MFFLRYLSFLQAFAPRSVLARGAVRSVDETVTTPDAADPSFPAGREDAMLAKLRSEKAVGVLGRESTSTAKAIEALKRKLQPSEVKQLAASVKDYFKKHKAGTKDVDMRGGVEDQLDTGLETSNSGTTSGEITVQNAMPSAEDASASWKTTTRLEDLSSKMKPNKIATTVKNKQDLKNKECDFECAGAGIAGYFVCAGLCVAELKPSEAIGCITLGCPPMVAAATEGCLKVNPACKKDQVGVVNGVVAEGITSILDNKVGEDSQGSSLVISLAKRVAKQASTGKFDKKLHVMKKVKTFGVFENFLKGKLKQGNASDAKRTMDRKDEHVLQKMLMNTGRSEVYV